MTKTGVEFFGRLLAGNIMYKTGLMVFVGLLLCFFNPNMIQANPSTEHILALNKQAQKAYRVNPDSAESLLHEALELAINTDDREGLATTYNNLGIILRNKGQNLIALDMYRKSLDYRRQPEDQVKIANTLENIGILYENMDSVDQALEYYEQCLEIREKLGDKAQLAKSYHNLGKLNTKQELYDLALPYLHKSLRIQKELDDLYKIVAVSTTIGNLYSGTGDTDSAYQYHQQALEISRNLNDSLLMGSSLINLGKIFMEAGELGRSLEQHLEALSLFEKLGIPQGILDAKINIGAVQERRKNYQEAAEAYLQALEISKEIGSQSDRQLIYFNLFALHNQIEQYKDALDYFRKYEELKDSLYEATTQEKLAEAAAKFDWAEQEKQLEKVRAQLATERSSKLMLAGGLILTLLIAVLAFQWQRARRLEVERTHNLNQQIMIDILRDQELESLDAMLEGQESERKRIAADLHDSLGGTLAAVKVSLYTLQKKLENQPEAIQAASKQTNLLLEEACEEVRRISHDMAGNTLRHTGLIQALKELFDTLSGTNQFQMTMETSGIGEERFERTVEINLYRIVQELFQNIVKHSEATRVSLQFSRHKDRLTIMVEDNGIGFEYNPQDLHESMGLSNIAARVSKLKGTLAIDSEIGQGTTTVIDIPL